MAVPPHPSGYDETWDLQASRNDCHITVGFDKQNNYIPCFLIQLHYTTSFFPRQWTKIAQFDHNETSPIGHDIYQEGIHVDVYPASQPKGKLHPRHGALPPNRGKVISLCVNYFVTNDEYFVDVYRGNISSTAPPGWPDGGEQPRNLIREKRIVGRMSSGPRGEDTVSREELDEILAEATGTTPEEIRRGAEDIEIAPPEEADIVSIADE
jgi:hypothetical protein